MTRRIPRSLVCSSAAAVAAMLLCLPASPAALDLRLMYDRVWFTPAPGSLDMRRLFEAPEEWAGARGRIQVFKFYQQHTDPVPPNIVGPNSYHALAAAGAFSRLTREWRKRIALEAGSVKEFYCTGDGSGMRASVAASVRSLEAVRAAGGIVSYLAMDEPFLSGLSPRCGGPSLDPTADRLREYMTGVHRAHAGVRIALIEAYPTFTPGDFATMLQLMAARGTPAAFLHADVDLAAMRPGHDEFGRDMIRLSDIAHAHGIPFGIIIWGNDGEADARYAADATRLANAVNRTFRHPSVLPEHLIFQSWAASETGLRITPSNLPEQQRDTHTWLLNTLLEQLRAGYRGGR